LVKCSECAKELDEKKAVKLTIDGKRRYFHLHHVRNVAQRSLSSVVLSKTSAELIATVAGIGGIVYTLQSVVEIALVMDTLSAVAAIAALFVGIEHLRYLKEHDLLRRAVLLIGLSIIVIVAIIVWHFGFRLD
jgi:FtsH-binding integral membrane protein